ncbi:putative transcription factor C2H2 family [Rosa chinensis]|uniref:Putative transcription factor C2H2 family n=1 Tax=Rosa chinensis TaxID=74649 RepID=A0A2P6RAR6_ROSCH|nr:zinc finger protein JACKDAW [Rosa chinensis]PRQ43522.1 putative transcription factor C2H2 family [Rosa chinensis]
MMSGDGYSLIPSAMEGFDHQLNPANPSQKSNPVVKKKRNLPGTPDPDAEVIALSPTTLMATNRFICEICNKGFQRDQNLQLHRRGHNLPWKLRQRTNKDVIKKKVYICPEKTCVHHDPSRALGDLTGIKKHFSRKHGEKKWKCEKCSKKYAVQSDWKAHSKTCGTREYKCDCGTLFSRKDSFITHRAFCDALTEESARLTSAAAAATNLNFGNDPTVNNTMINSQAVQDVSQISDFDKPSRLSFWLNQQPNNLNVMDMAVANPNNLYEMVHMGSATSLFGSNSMSNFGASTSTSSANLSLSSPIGIKDQERRNIKANIISKPPAAPMSATALLQKAAQLGSTRSSNQPLSGSSVGVMTSPSSSNTMSFNSRSNELNQLFQSSTTTSSNLVSSLSCSSNSLEQVMKFGGANSNAIDHQNSLTRDFLGVGDRQIHNRQFLPHELAKFGSMSSAAMGLSPFTGNH